MLLLELCAYGIILTWNYLCVLQKIADGLRKSRQKMVVCGSSQRMMQGLVLDQSEPLYGRCRVILRLDPIGYNWIGKAFPHATALERLEHYAVWGGVPSALFPEFETR